MSVNLSRRDFSLAALYGAAGWQLKAATGGGLKVYISADMEGISGITHAGETIAGYGGYDITTYRAGCKLMAEDINACVAGCFDAGATEVVVRDGHGSGTNVDPADIDPRAQLLQGANDLRYDKANGDAAMILLGFHAKALTPGAIFHHSFSSLTIQGIWLNEREVGEIGIIAAIVGEYKIPVVLATGCNLAMAEAREWIPGVMTYETKRSTGVQSAECVPVEESRRKIRELTAEAVKRRHEIKPLKVDYPVTIRWHYLPKGSKRTYDPEFKPTSEPRVVTRSGESVERVFRNK